MRLRITVLGWDVLDLSTEKDDAPAAPGQSTGAAAWSADLTPAPHPFGFAPLQPNDEPVQWDE